MAKIKLVECKNSKGEIWETQWHYKCLGCGKVHALSPNVHTFNEDFDKPTFMPSVLHNFNPSAICHAWIKDGFIQYLSDCDHSLRGQTIELPEYD